jgi:hypothetical protein
MSFQEKSTWLFGVIVIAGYAVYLAIVLPALLGGASIAEVSYQIPMLATIGGAILAGIVGGILLGITSPRDAGKVDQRDREIERFGEHIGQSFTVIGGIAALVLSLVEAPCFWIANTLYLGFVLSGLLAVLAKLAAYRRGFQPW